MPSINPLSNNQGGSAWDPYNLAKTTIDNAKAQTRDGFNPMGRTSGLTAPQSRAGEQPSNPSNPSNPSSPGQGDFDYGSAGLQTHEEIKEASKKVKDQVLTQKDFLLLLTTQLQAQDPTKPADNNELVSQMSQLSMVESLNSINGSMENVLSQVGASSAMNSTNLIGTYVYTDSNQGYFGGSPNSPALWSIDAGDETYSNVKLTIKDAQTGEIVYTDTADTITGEIKYAWPGILSPNGPVKPNGPTSPDGPTNGTDPDAGPVTPGDPNQPMPIADADGGTAGGNGAGTGGTGPDGKPLGPDGKPVDPSDPSKPSEGEGDGNKYTYCNPGRYVIEVTGTATNGASVNLKTKGLGFVSSVTIGKTLKDTMLNLSGLGEMSFEKANRVTL